MRSFNTKLRHIWHDLCDKRRQYGKMLENQFKNLFTWMKHVLVSHIHCVHRTTQVFTG